MKEPTTIEKLRCTSLLILMALVLYVLAESSGIAHNMNEPLSPSQTALTGPRRVTIVETICVVSLLDDPVGNEIRIMFPPLKKRFLDSLTYLARSELVFHGDVTDETFNNILTKLAKETGANIVLIDYIEMQNISIELPSVLKSVNIKMEE